MGEEDASGWDGVVREWLVDGGTCCAGALASVEDCAIYAAAADADMDGWATMFKEDHDEEVLGEDGETMTTVTINEPETIRQAVVDGKCPHGMWLGGKKFRVVRQENGFDYQDAKFDLTFCAKLKGGCHLVKTEGGTVVLALYDEEKDQTSADARLHALIFAEYMAQQGY